MFIIHLLFRIILARPQRCLSILFDQMTSAREALVHLVTVSCLK